MLSLAEDWQRRLPCRPSRAWRLEAAGWLEAVGKKALLLMLAASEVSGTARVLGGWLRGLSLGPRC